MHQNRTWLLHRPQSPLHRPDARLNHSLQRQHVQHVAAHPLPCLVHRRRMPECWSHLLLLLAMLPLLFRIQIVLRNVDKHLARVQRTVLRSRRIVRVQDGVSGETVGGRHADCVAPRPLQFKVNQCDDYASDAHRRTKRTCHVAMSTGTVRMSGRSHCEIARLA